MEAEGRCTAFQRLDWIEAVATHLRDARREDLFVIEVRDAASQRPVMLLPLLRRRRLLHTVLTWPGSAVCDYNAPLLALDADWTAESAAEAWRAICKVLPHSDLLCVDRAPSHVEGAINPLVLLGGTRLSATSTCGLQLGGDPETVVERHCDARFVKKLGKTGRRLARRGPVRLVEARTRAQVDDLFETLLRQRRSRFIELGRPDLLSRPHVADFYRAAAIEGLDGGAVRLLGLRVGDEWAGTFYGLRQGDAFLGVIVTIADTTWRNCSPGLHVLAHVIRWASETGVGYFDLSIGPASYKDQIGGKRSALYALDQPTSVPGAAILFALRAWAALKSSVRRHRKAYAAARSVWRIVGSPDRPIGGQSVDSGLRGL